MIFIGRQIPDNEDNISFEIELIFATDKGNQSKKNYFDRLDQFR